MAELLSLLQNDVCLSPACRVGRWPSPCLQNLTSNADIAITINKAHEDVDESHGAENVGENDMNWFVGSTAWTSWNYGSSNDCWCSNVMFFKMNGMLQFWHNHSSSFSQPLLIEIEGTIKTGREANLRFVHYKSPQLAYNISSLFSFRQRNSQRSWLYDQKNDGMCKHSCSFDT